MEQPFLLSRWKGYHDTLQIYDFIEKFATKYSQQPCYLALPFHAIKDLSHKISSEKLVIGAEHMNAVSGGAFTFGVAASMLKKAGAQFVMIGSADQRQLFNESNAEVHDKLLHALEHKLKPILCLQAEADLEQELREGIGNFNAEQIGKISLLLETIGLENAFRRPTHEELLKIYQDFSRLAESVLGSAFSSAKIVYSVPPDIDRFTDLFMEQPAAGFYSPYPDFFLDLLKQDLHLQVISLPEPIEEEVENAEVSSQDTIEGLDGVLEDKNHVLEDKEREIKIIETAKEGEAEEVVRAKEVDVSVQEATEPLVVAEVKESLDASIVKDASDVEEALKPEGTLEASSVSGQTASEMTIEDGDDESTLGDVSDVEENVITKGHEEIPPIPEEIALEVPTEESKELFKNPSLPLGEPPKEGEVHIHTVGDITKSAHNKK